MYAPGAGPPDVLMLVRLVAAARKVGRRRLQIAVGRQRGGLAGGKSHERSPEHALLQFRRVHGRVFGQLGQSENP